MNLHFLAKSSVLSVHHLAQMIWKRITRWIALAVKFLTKSNAKQRCKFATLQRFCFPNVCLLIDVLPKCSQNRKRKKRLHFSQECICLIWKLFLGNYERVIRKHKKYLPCYFQGLAWLHLCTVCCICCMTKDAHSGQTLPK